MYCILIRTAGLRHCSRWEDFISIEPAGSLNIPDFQQFKLSLLIYIVVNSEPSNKQQYH